MTVHRWRLPSRCKQCAESASAPLAVLRIIALVIALLPWTSKTLALGTEKNPEGPILVDANYLVTTCPGCPPLPTSVQILVLFDEAVDVLTATNSANYSFFETEVPAHSIPIVDASMWPSQSANMILVTLAELPEQTRFTLMISDVMDTDGHVMEPEQFVIIDVIETGVTPSVATLKPRLLSNVPNPFNPATQIRYFVPAQAVGGRILIELYDVRGRLVRRLLDESATSDGVHDVRWDGQDASGRAVASGVYTVFLLMGDEMSSRKVALLK